MAYTIAAAIVAICVAFVFILAWCAGGVGAAQGFWVASDQFKESAKVDQIVFYVGEGARDGSRDGSRDGYLIVAADGATKFNGPVQLKIARQWFGGDVYDITMSHTGVMPQQMVMVIDRAAGSMTLKDKQKKTLYADLFRDNQMSAYALDIGAEGAEGEVAAAAEGEVAAAPAAEGDAI